MGTEVAISFSTLRTQLENEKSSLYKIDESIKKIVQTPLRFNNDRYNNSSGDYGRNGPRSSGRNSFVEATNNLKNEEHFGKRKHETKTVFSRLSAWTGDSDGEGEGEGEGGGGGKRTRLWSAVTRELPSRAEVVRAQGGDERARDRNRRMFGSLLGTLQKFKQEEIVLQTKVDKKAQVERKIEEQARLQKEKEQKERKSLFAEREHKKATIKALEGKMLRMSEFESWEAAHKCLGNFILTKTKPHIYWLPKIMNDKATDNLTASSKYHEKILAKKHQELQDELQRIEQRCLRTRPINDNTNSEHTDPGAREQNPVENSPKEEDGDNKSKRDKFAIDEDEDRDDSDGEEPQPVGDQPESQMEMSVVIAQEPEPTSEEPEDTVLLEKP